MLIEELFARGIMTMGPSRRDPDRQVGTFTPETPQKMSAVRLGEMERFRWIAGDWNFENRVPATRLSPAYTDAGSVRFSLSGESGWVSMALPDGSLRHCLTFDPFSRQWIYVLTRGSFGMLRSREGWAGNRITFCGPMTMIGIDCEWRMAWTKISDDEFGFVNEEKLADGSWGYIDEWRYTRVPA